MFPEHTAILQAHRTMQRHAEARAIDQAQLHYTATQLFHWAMSNAYLMAYILAEIRGDASPEFQQGLQLLHLDCLRQSHPLSQYERIARHLRVFAHKLSTESIRYPS